MKGSEIRQAAGERCEGWGLGQKLRVGYRARVRLLRHGGRPVSGGRWSDSSSHLLIICVVSPERAIH